MKNLRIILVACFLFMTAGCGNLSPRVDPHLQQQIDNQNGKIEEMESMQNSIKNEMLNNQQRMEGQLSDVQQGMLNVQGITILSGPAGLAISFSVILVFITIWYYRDQARQNEKAMNILAETIKNYKDPELESQAVLAVMNTEVEHKVLKKLSKN